jgi:enterochelin esterase-like enzyme
MNSSNKALCPWLAFSLIWLWGCGAEAPASNAGTDGGSGGNGGQSPATGGAAGALGGAGGVSGASNAGAGNGGSAGGGSGGSAGSAGAAPDPFSCTPGLTGNGIHDQPGPYTRPPEAFPVEGTPQGTLSALTAFPSPLYAGHEFGYRLYVPAQYVQGSPAALIVFQDGPSHYLGLSDAKFYAQHVLDNLIAAGELPVTLALFVDPCMTACEAERVAIYDTPDDKYARFLTEELIPGVVLNQYSVVQDRDAWATVGFSAGGIQGFTVLWNRPEFFSKIIGHNTSFPAAKDHGVDYEALIASSENKGLRVSLVSGTGDLSDDRGNWLEASTAIAEALTAKGYDARMMSGTGGHYPPDQSAMDFPNALRWLFAGCTFNAAP